MVAANTPFDELQRRFEIRRKQLGRVDEIVSAGFISYRLGEYAKHLLVLDQLADQAEVYARLFEPYKVTENLAEMKGRLDGVAAVLMADGKLETESIGSGLSAVKNPNFNNISKYQELYDFAKQKCYDALARCNELMGAAA